MESLGDVLKSMPNGQWMDQIEQQKKQLFEQPLIQKFRKVHPELTDAHLVPYLNRLYQYTQEYRHCTNCPGLERCPNDFQGHYTKLEVETLNGQPFIHDSKVPCKKLLSKQSDDAIKRRVTSFFIDASALRDGYSFQDILSLDLKRSQAVMRIADYIQQTRTEGLQTKGLYLAGPFGTGKTYLMGYLLHELAKIGLSGVIVYMPDFIEELKSQMHEPGKIKETIELLKQADLLVFDDIGAENMNPWVRDHIMGAILNYRMNRKPTFYTSNHDLASLQSHFSFTSKDGDDEHKGQRIMDRIRHFVDVVMVLGSNKRSTQ